MIVKIAIGTVLVFVGMATAGRATLDGSWRGTLEITPPRASSAVTASLAQSARALTGTMTIDASMGGTFAIAGSVHGARAAVRGLSGARRLRWRARWSAKQHAWRGPMLLREGADRMRGRLALLAGGSGDGGSGAPACGNEYFASDVMPKVMVPICSQCHVPGGLAKAAAFRVTVGDAMATATSAAAQVDAGDPAVSRILAKPTGAVAHGGGTQVQHGSVEEDILKQWIALVVAPGCGAGGGDGGGGGGGSGGGGGGTGADLYATYCATCHGADARGVDGHPDVRCARSIADAVRTGRTGPSGTMPAIALSDAEIALVQTFLDGLCPAGGDGGSLWAGNCGGCHGADAGGTVDAPSVRCATRVADAVTVGRGARMPAFPALAATDVAVLDAWLDAQCAAHGRTGSDLWAGNCASCHGATAGGGRSGLGVRGPDVRCTETQDYAEKVRFGEEGMPAFPRLDAVDVTAIVGFVHGTFCAGG
jgi:mono/diheme cytochrome c family protein